MQTEHAGRRTTDVPTLQQGRCWALSRARRIPAIASVPCTCYQDVAIEPH